MLFIRRIAHRASRRKVNSRHVTSCHVKVETYFLKSLTWTRYVANERVILLRLEHRTPIHLHYTTAHQDKMKIPLVVHLIEGLLLYLLSIY